MRPPTRAVGTMEAMGRNRRFVVKVAFVLAAVAALAFWFLPDRKPALDIQPAQVSVTVSSPHENPDQWMAPPWQTFFANEDWRKGDLQAFSAIPSDLERTSEALEVATRALKARLGAVDAPDLADWLADPLAGELDTLGFNPDRAYDGKCSEVEVLASSAMSLPSPQPDLAKVLLVWGGDCVDSLTAAALDGAPRDPARSQLSAIYLQRSDDRWVPVRLSQLPGSAAGVWDAGEVPVASMLAEVSCNDSSVVVRVEVAEVTSRMCEDAANDKVSLTLVGGWRTWEQENEFFVSATNEQDRVRHAMVDGRCATRQCAGWVVEVTGGDFWLSEPVGCMGADGRLVSDASACSGGSLVSRAASYGFAQPLAWDAGYLDWANPPAVRVWAANCDPPGLMSAAETVAAVWRCVLGGTGASRETVAQAVAQALVVSRCESGWNSALQQKAPDGSFKVGVFQLPLGVLEGNNRSASPGDVARTAAELYIQDRDNGGSGFSFWPCAQLLQEPLPSWAWQW